MGKEKRTINIVILQIFLDGVISVSPSYNYIQEGGMLTFSIPLDVLCLIVNLDCLLVSRSCQIFL